MNKYTLDVNAGESETLNVTITHWGVGGPSNDSPETCFECLRVYAVALSPQPGKMLHLKYAIHP